MSLENHLLINSFEGEYYFLSNFYPVPVLFEGAFYPTVEHAFQSAKTIVQDERYTFRHPLITPGKAKSLGRAITLRADWEEVKDGIMREVLKYKFSDHHPVLKQRLLDTVGKELIEGNTWHDNVWGDCTCNESRCLLPGQNRLGKMLMELRASLNGDRQRVQNTCQS